MKQLFIAIGAPSGGGKGTIFTRLLTEMPQLQFAKSLTTRPKRQERSNFHKYLYVTPEEFQQAIEDNRLLEWVEYSGYLYGTLADPTVPVLLVELEIEGMKQIRAKGLPLRVIYLVPPGKDLDQQLEVLRERLHKRGNVTEEGMRRRLEAAKRELAQAPHIADHIVVNDDLETAYNECKAIITNLVSNQLEK